MDKNLTRTVFTHPIHWFAFGFGSGLSPVAPGTMGSLVALPIIYLMSYLSWPVYALITLLVLVVGTYAAGWSSAQLKVHDFSGIVIDEIAGMMLLMLFLPINLVNLILGFALFRLFDIWKPWPIRWVDARITGGLGIMLDDVLAAVYALLSIWAIQELLYSFHININ